MSASMMEFSFVVSVEDSQHWLPENVAAAHASDAGSYEQWAIAPLIAVMRAAGEAYVAAHPDLFAGELT